jgi:hypothetical protein
MIIGPEAEAAKPSGRIWSRSCAAVAMLAVRSTNRQEASEFQGIRSLRSSSTAFTVTHASFRAWL